MSEDQTDKKQPTVDELTPQQIQGVIRRDRKHLSEFCVRVIPIFRAVAYSRLVAANQYSRAKQEDLVQSLIEAALREDTVRKWSPELGQLSTFLRVFARRRALDLLERKDGRSCEKLMEEAELTLAAERQLPEESLSPESLIVWKRIQREALANPNSQYVELFQLHFLQGYTPEEIAARYGEDIQNIYKRIQRMRKDILRLRDRLLQT